MVEIEPEKKTGDFRVKVFVVVYLVLVRSVPGVDLRDWTEKPEANSDCEIVRDLSAHFNPFYGA